AEVMTAYLEKDGFDVQSTTSGLNAVKLIKELRPNLVVLDLMLPDLSGEEICTQVRRFSDVPIIMVTALTSEDNRVAGLTIGADDYLTKPFSPRELVARVHSILRRVDSKNLPLADIITFDSEKLSIDITRHEVKIEGTLVSLTPLEFKLLVTLARYPGRVYSRLELVNKLQGYDFIGYERTIDAHVKNLRQKIESNSKKPRFIKTVFGVGYKFEA
ncbi:MAG TPA: response regulator transcription factor, partial [Actinobacteria bacterium]|nr:response regulator transcription factor [Actinomycetes bacterium]HEX21193.1 response regulator transcription factor [Actinomycetota bacterium]